MQGEHFDIIIIGSGAGGGTVAQALSETGKSILILERGEHLPVEDDNWSAEAVFIDRKYRTDEKWRDKKGKEFIPNTHYWVGGNTSFYGSVLMRFRREDFEARAHKGGLSPAWPVSYDDMAPYYDRAETLWQVRGLRPSDPTAPKGAPDFSYPPVAHEPEIDRFTTHLREAHGWNPFHLPLGVRRTEGAPDPGPCIKCTTCGGFPCKLKAKVDARTVAIDPLLQAPNVTLKTGYLVQRLETDAAGTKVTAIVCDGPEGEARFSSDLVVLAAGAANTAAVLLRSASAAHPNGLANGSDQVGRNYMFHTMTAVVSVTSHHVDADFPKTLGINDFYNRDPEGGFDFPMGHVQSLEYMEGATLEGQLKSEIGFADKLIPNWFSDAIAHRMLSFLILSEDLPLPDNRVLWQDGQIHLHYDYNNLEGHKRLVKKFDAALDDFCDERHKISDHHFQMSQLLPIYGTAHQCGTARMGDDPKTSVVNRDCKAHELDNLYITDTSVFVSSAAVNPTLTLVANSLRVADHLIDRLAGVAKVPAPIALTSPADTALAKMKRWMGFGG